MQRIQPHRGWNPHHAAASLLLPLFLGGGGGGGGGSGSSGSGSGGGGGSARGSSQRVATDPRGHRLQMRQVARV